MEELFRTLIRLKDKKLTVMVVDPNHPDDQTNASIVPQHIFTFLSLSVVVLVFVLGVLLYLTPLGELMFDAEDKEVKAQVIEITNRISALQDSLEVRDFQLDKLKKVFASNIDTTLEVDSTLIRASEQFPADSNMNQITFSTFSDDNSLQTFEMGDHIISALTDNQLNDNLFPAYYPVKGTFSRDFDSKAQHYGLDIAANEGSIVRAVAGGIVVHSQWTMNYGHVVVIQHMDGYLTVYKHLSHSFKKEGDSIAKGDVIGGVGESGLVSSGVHLHFELWKNGVPLNPKDYLIEI